MDKAYQAMMEQVSATSMQISGGAPAESREAIQFLLSPDGRAFSAIMAALITSAGITLFSMIGGALEPASFMAENASPRNP